MACTAGKYKALIGPSDCIPCKLGSDSESGAAACSCLSGYEPGNGSIIPYDPGSFCSDPECPSNGTYTELTGMLCRLRYRNNEAAHWFIAPTAPFSGLLLTFLRFDTELQHDFVAVYACTSVACCSPGSAAPPAQACLASTPVLLSGAVPPDSAVEPDPCGRRPLLRKSGNPIRVTSLPPLAC